MKSRKVHIEPQFVSLKLGKSFVTKLRDLAIKESVRKNEHVTPADIVREALSKLHPELFCGDASSV